MTGVLGETPGDAAARMIVVCGILGWVIAGFTGLLVGSIIVFTAACTTMEEGP